MQLRLVTGETRSALDPLPFPVNAVRALGQPKAAKREPDHAAGRISPSWWGREQGSGPEALDSISNIEAALARVDDQMGELVEGVERVLASPFVNRGEDGPRAA
jgi:hypothetical protein